MWFRSDMVSRVDAERPSRGLAMVPLCSVIEQLMTGDDEPYLAITVQNDTLKCYLQQLREYLGEGDYARYTANQQLRDGGGYHITVVSPAELGELVETDMDILLTNQPMQCRLIGVGRARQEGDTAYFIVCESEELQHFRASLGLGRKDMHVTLGFEAADVHKVAKDATTLIEPIAEMNQ